MLSIQSPTPEALARAVDILREGGLVGLPTETVYGLAGNARDDRAVASIFAAKGRPRFNPLIVHISCAEEAKALAHWNARAEALAERFWPGPLTLLLPRREDSGLSLLASAGSDRIALRVPSHPVALALLEEAGLPLAAPSANRSGRISPTKARHVWEELGEAVPLILEGGPCSVGVESTILDLCEEKPRLLRPGGVTPDAIEALLGVRLEAPRNGEIQAPGQLASHYAPSLPVRLRALEAEEGEILLAFGPDAPQGANLLNLSEAGDLTEAAARLFACLRACDRPPYRSIAVMPIPEHGLGLAINDRLKRAAHDRGLLR
jgi:L-threonylcarbamoyladenylate synthase